MEKQIIAAKSNGPIKTTFAHLDRNADRIKAGKITRMDAIHALEAKGVKRSTAVGAIVKWMRANKLEWAARTPPGRKTAAKAKKSITKSVPK